MVLILLVSYIGLEKTELAKERKLILHLFQEFCRGTSLDLYITGWFRKHDNESQELPKYNITEHLELNNDN